VTSDRCTTAERGRCAGLESNYDGLDLMQFRQAPLTRLNQTKKLTYRAPDTETASGQRSQEVDQVDPFERDPSSEQTSAPSGPIAPGIDPIRWETGCVKPVGLRCVGLDVKGKLHEWWEGVRELEEAGGSDEGLDRLDLRDRCTYHLQYGLSSNLITFAGTYERQRPGNTLQLILCQLLNVSSESLTHNGPVYESCPSHQGRPTEEVFKDEPVDNFDGDIEVCDRSHGVCPKTETEM